MGKMIIYAKSSLCVAIYIKVNYYTIAYNTCLKPIFPQNFGAKIEYFYCSASKQFLIQYLTLIAGQITSF